MKDIPHGFDLLRDPALNKGTAFSEEERSALKLRGLLPPRVFTLQEQELRVLGNYHRKTSNLEKYIFLMSLQNRNEHLFYRTVLNNIEEMLPIIYTPTVGEACGQYAHIFREPRGLYLSARDKGRIGEVMGNWHTRDVSIIVVTDGERILGLGDLGADGMGIPVGKLSLYTVCAGVHPARCLPITLDVGTNNEELKEDPLYIGLRQSRIEGEEYDAFLDEFVQSAQQIFPEAIVQFEDFGKSNAYRLLDKYRATLRCFNDDIQGTGAVALAGILTALRITDSALTAQTLLFLGAGEAGAGIADTVIAEMVRTGVLPDEAGQRCWLMDSKGLIVASRQDLEAHKVHLAHEHDPITSLSEAIHTLRPTILIGTTAQPGIFTREVIEAMGEINERPVIFALSNPTSKSECTAGQAYTWTQGRAIFASGSPFDPVQLDGHTYKPSQCNNVYVFPGLGLGVMASGATRVSDDMFLAAAHALSNAVSEETLAEGLIYPPLSKIREVSAAIAFEVARVAQSRGDSVLPDTVDLRERIRSLIYEPVYESYV